MDKENKHAKKRITYVCLYYFSIQFSLLFFRINSQQLTTDICKQQTRLLMNNLHHIKKLNRQHMRQNNF